MGLPPVNLGREVDGSPQRHPLPRPRFRPGSGVCSAARRENGPWTPETRSVASADVRELRFRVIAAYAPRLLVLRRTKWTSARAPFLLPRCGNPRAAGASFGAGLPGSGGPDRCRSTLCARAEISSNAVPRARFGSVEPSGGPRSRTSRCGLGDHGRETPNPMISGLIASGAGLATALGTENDSEAAWHAVCCKSCGVG